MLELFWISWISGKVADLNSEKLESICERWSASKIDEGYQADVKKTTQTKQITRSYYWKVCGVEAPTANVVDSGVAWMLVATLHYFASTSANNTTMPEGFSSGRYGLRRRAHIRGRVCTVRKGGPVSLAANVQWAVRDHAPSHPIATIRGARDNNAMTTGRGGPLGLCTRACVNPPGPLL